MAMFDLAQMMGRMRGREGGFVGRPAPAPAPIQEAPPPMVAAAAPMGLPAGGGFGSGITASLGQAMGPRPALPPPLQITSGAGPMQPPPRILGGAPMGQPSMPVRRPQMGPPTMGRRPMMRRMGGFGNGMSQ